MKNILRILIVVAFALLGMGCSRYVTPVMPPQGLLFTSLSAPLTTNFTETPVGTKKVQASTFYFHVPFVTGADFAWGEAGLKDACANANIRRVAYSDYHILMILGIFGTFTVTAYGE